uniref:Uncharacterized protein n=1 Tax=Oryza rufipogon TaxID=4529 RepID=A0A0E0NNE6_ORYRU
MNSGSLGQISKAVACLGRCCGNPRETKIPPIPNQPSQSPPTHPVGPVPTFVAGGVGSGGGGSGRALGSGGVGALKEEAAASAVAVLGAEEWSYARSSRC